MVTGMTCANIGPLTVVSGLVTFQHLCAFSVGVREGKQPYFGRFVQLGTLEDRGGRLEAGGCGAGWRLEVGKIGGKKKRG